MSGYRELKLALELFKRPPGQLEGDEAVRLARAAERQSSIEAKILRSPEAASVIVGRDAVATRRREIAARYPDADSMRADMAAVGLDEASLDAELSRELVIESVLEQVAARTPLTTEVDAEIFYRVNFSRFARPERRRLRHLLVVFNDPAEKNSAEVLLKELAPQIDSEETFAKAAARHSNCPTGIDGGVLGTLPRGKLYVELDEAAFALPQGGVSAPVATEVGLHLIRCDEIQPASTPPFSEVREKITTSLDDRRRREAQKRWIESLDE